MRCPILSALLCITLLTSTAHAADEAFNLPYLQQLFNSHQRQQAYDYASRYLADMEGDGNFDYIYGVSAIDAGHASQGVFALERVLMQFPNDHVARLELARGYFILEEYARSRLEFEKVLAVNPPKGVRETTEAFLYQIRLKEARYRTTTGGFVALGLGSDSNVASGPDDSQIGYYTLPPTAIKQDDLYNELSASWGIGHPFAPGWMATGNITAVLHRNQDWDVFNSTNATLQAGVSRIDRDSRYKAELIYQQYTIDGFEQNDRDMTGLNLDWEYFLTQKTRFNTGLQYLMLEYPSAETRNSSLTSFTFTLTQSYSTMWNPVLFASFNLGQETPDVEPNSAVDRDILGYRLGTILSFTTQLALQASLGLQASEFPKATYPFFGTLVREDDYTTANINLLWLINKDWRLDTKLGYSKNDSNVEIYSYDRTIIGLEANYSF